MGKWDINWMLIWNMSKPFIKMILIFLIGHFVVKYIMKIMRRAFKHTTMDASLVKFILKTVSIVLHIIVIMSALTSIGVSTTGAIAALSAAGVAIAVGLKDSLANVAGGILLLLSPRFLTGDFIEVEDDSGTVKKVDLLHTTITTPDNKVISIPNGVLINSHITNYSRQDKRRVEIIFPVSYEADIEKTKNAIMSVVKSHEKVINEPDEPFARVLRYSESSVDVVMRCWCATGDYWTVFFDLNEQVRVELDKNGISIPFNQLDVHIKKD